MAFWILKWLLPGPIVRWYCRPVVVTAEHLPPAGPVILAPNHLAEIDSLVLSLAVARRPTFLAEREYFAGTGVRGAWCGTARRLFGADVGNLSYISTRRPVGRTQSTAPTVRPSFPRLAGDVVAHPDLQGVFALVDDESVRLIRAAAALSDLDARAPSALPGWSRGHVLTHVARNADALINLLTGVRTHSPRTMYPEPQARDADIESGAHRPADDLVADVRSSSARLQEAAELLGADADWDAVVEWRAGRRRPIRDIPRARLTEVVLHHIDLDVGYAVADMTSTVAEQVVLEALGRLRGVPDFPAIEVRPTDGQATTVAADASDHVTVSGSTAQLAGWLTGRTTSAGLDADDPLPPVPAWT